mmetsp:Transcript_63644/g.199343  ORF Transcript_63644/g.199343 Transcript_63644/m.199343 type:complete len:202 (+) Transcript_63644:941-1546(+)
MSLWQRNYSRVLAPLLAGGGSQVEDLAQGLLAGLLARNVMRDLGQVDLLGEVPLLAGWPGVPEPMRSRLPVRRRGGDVRKSVQEGHLGLHLAVVRRLAVAVVGLRLLDAQQQLLQQRGGPVCHEAHAVQLAEAPGPLPRQHERDWRRFADTAELAHGALVKRSKVPELPLHAAQQSALGRQLLRRASEGFELLPAPLHGGQ